MRISIANLKEIIKQEAKMINEGSDWYSEDLAAADSGFTIETLKRDLNVLLENWPDHEHPYYQDLYNLMEDYSAAPGRPTRLPDEPEDDDPGFTLPRPKEDPMGRGSRTSALRRSVMRK